MFVCHCRAVTDSTIRATIQQGARTLCDLAEGCGAGSRCGGCHVMLERMLSDAGLALDTLVTAAAACAA